MLEFKVGAEGVLSVHDTYDYGCQLNYEDCTVWARKLNNLIELGQAQRCLAG